MKTLMSSVGQIRVGTTGGSGCNKKSGRVDKVGLGLHESGVCREHERGIEKVRKKREREMLGER